MYEDDKPTLYVLAWFIASLFAVAIMLGLFTDMHWGLSATVGQTMVTTWVAYPMFLRKEDWFGPWCEFFTSESAFIKYIYILCWPISMPYLKTLSARSGTRS